MTIQSTRQNLQCHHFLWGQLAMACAVLDHPSLHSPESGYISHSGFTTSIHWMKFAVIQDLYSEKIPLVSIISNTGEIRWAKSPLLPSTSPKIGISGQTRFQGGDLFTYEGLSGGNAATIKFPTAALKNWLFFSTARTIFCNGGGPGFFNRNDRSRPQNTEVSYSFPLASKHLQNVGSEKENFYKKVFEMLPHRFFLDLLLGCRFQSSMAIISIIMDSDMTDRVTITEPCTEHIQPLTSQLVPCPKFPNGLPSWKSQS